LEKDQENCSLLLKRVHGGIHRRSIDVTDAQLDALEVRGYLDPDRRGD
jgi:hypothetical protein